MGFNPSNPPPRYDFAQPHRAEYPELRQRAILHMFINSSNLRATNPRELGRIAGTAAARAAGTAVGLM